MEPRSSTSWNWRYLDLLGVEFRQPDMDALARLTCAHLRRIPFENVSSILRRKAQPSGPVADPDADAILDAWIDRRAGGVCFEINPMFERLLVGLGYQVYPVMADSSFPGSHQAMVVRLGSAQYLVDVGNSAPLFDPVPLVGVFEVVHVGLAYRFRADEREADIWCLDRWIGGTWTPFMRYHLRPATPDERQASYQHHHTPGKSWVVDSLRVMRCEQDEVWLIRDQRLTRFTDAGKHVELIRDRAAYVRIVADVLRMPSLPIGAAIDVLNTQAAARGVSSVST